MRRLRVYSVLFFLLLAIPFAILIERSYSNLNQESFFYHRRTAASVVTSIGQQLGRRLQTEEARSYTEYRYVHVPGSSVPSQEGLNLSPLSAFPPVSEIPGILGYFQIDPDGSFHTPLLPDDSSDTGLVVPQRFEREALRDRLIELLQGRLVSAPARSDFSADLPTAEELSPGVDQDSKLRANLASNTDLRLQQKFVEQAEAAESFSYSASRPESSSPLPQRRMEPTSERQALVFDDQLQEAYRAKSAGQESPAPGAGVANVGRSALKTKEEAAADRLPGRETEQRLSDDADLQGAEVDPFRAQVLEGKWIVLERRVWWKERRYTQGLVAQLPEFSRQLIEPAVQASALPPSAGYLLFHQGELIRSSAPTLDQSRKPLLLESSTLPAPLSSLNLALTVDGLPAGPGRRVVDLMAILAAVTIVAGVWGGYRLSSRQLQMTQRQNNFVSAISHELKTPLTSIRMFGEMLMEGWVEDETKKQAYYRHIHDESERLTRLIQNVLRLAQLEQGHWEVKLTEEDPVELVKAVVRQLEKPLGRAGFAIVTEIDAQPHPIRIDRDALTQVLINLLDNAVKFARDCQVRKIVIGVAQEANLTEITVRDFGPGIPRGEEKRIFERFYRIGSEMTRSTQGTGIGLALVRMLTESMGGRVAVSNRGPGAEFRLSFPSRPA